MDWGCVMPFYDSAGAQGYLGRYRPGDAFQLTLARGQTWADVEIFLTEAASELGTCEHLSRVRSTTSRFLSALAHRLTLVRPACPSPSCVP